MKPDDFILNTGISVRKVIDSKPCENGLQKFLSYIVHKTDVTTFEEIIEKDVLAQIFDHDEDWYGYAKDQHWVAENFDEIDDDAIYQSVVSKNLYRITRDNDNLVVVLFNISCGNFWIISYDDITRNCSYEDAYTPNNILIEETIQALQEYVEMELVKTSLTMKDIIFKKYHTL